MLAKVISAPHPLYLTYQEGRSDCLVLAFTGVGNRIDPIPAPEAARLTGWDGENHVLFIADAARSWMNADGLVPALLAAVTQLVAQIKPARIVAFGNSMGGSMALIFARLFPVDAVLSIVPQYSVKAEIVPEERRWFHFRAHITDWKYPTVPDMTGLKNIMILHGGEAREIHHARRFGAASSVDHLIVPQYGYALAACLKRDGHLRPLLKYIILGDVPAARMVMKDAGAITFAQYWQQRKDAKRERRNNVAI